MCCADKRPSWRVLSETADSSRPLRKAPIGLFSSYSSLDPRTAQDEKETQLRALNRAVLLDLIGSNILKSRGCDSVVVMPLVAWSPVLYTTPISLIYRNFWTNLVHSVGQKPDASVCDAPTCSTWSLTNWILSVLEIIELIQHTPTRPKCTARVLFKVESKSVFFLI